MFSRMSTNYSADLSTRVEPCIFGGDPDCAQCGCAISSGLHWLKEIPLAGPLDRKSTRLNSSHLVISYAVFCLKKKKNITCYITINNQSDRHISYAASRQIHSWFQHSIVT